MAIAFVSGYIPWIPVRPLSHLQITAKAVLFLVELPKPSLADVAHALVPPAPVLNAGFSESTIPAHGPGFLLWWTFVLPLTSVCVLQHVWADASILLVGKVMVLRCSFLGDFSLS